MKCNIGIVIFSLVLICTSITSARNVPTKENKEKSYENFKVYRALIRNPSHAEFFKQLNEHSDEHGVDIWRIEKDPNTPVELMVEPKFQKKFESSLQLLNIPYEILNHDVQQQIDEVKTQNDNILFRRIGNQKKSGSLDLTRYYKYDEMIDYLNSIASKYPNQVKLYSGGLSYEQREIPVVEITNGDGNMDKDTIFIDAGIHAREWIAHAEALYIISQLVENSSAYNNLLSKLNFVILPNINPDGYVYSHTKDRMWRKTRSTNTQCFGTDGNRNFDLKWGLVGASSNPCADTYKGETPFSTEETRIVRNMLQKYQKNTKFYLTIHSYGNYLLYPWGYTSELPATWKEIDNLAQAGAKAIKQATGTNYKVGSSTNVLYAAAGGSDDYALGVLGIPYSITMELPGGIYGFNPPPSQIESLVTETWIGIKAMAEYLANKSTAASNNIEFE